MLLNWNGTPGGLNVIKKIRISSSESDLITSVANTEDTEME